MNLRRRTGEFWGRNDFDRRAGGFRFQVLQATAREEDVHLHSHDRPHFVLVLAGAYISSALGAPELSATPLLVFNPAGTTHRDRFLHGKGAFMALTIDNPDLAEADNAPDHAVTLSTPGALGCAYLLSAAIASDRPLALEGQALQLTAAVAADREPAARPPWLGRAFEMIWTAADPALTVVDVARDAGVHPVHLARVFRRHLGCAPGELLRGRRLERVTDVLGRGAASLADAASDHGFTDQSHLTKTFRDAFGLTPGAYRHIRKVARIQDEASEAA